MNNSVDINFRDLINKIFILLDDVKFYKPFANIDNVQISDSKDVIEIQKVAKKLSDHIGLSSLSFIITYGEQTKDRAGKIDLNKSLNVFIDISSDLTRTPNGIIATLCHEIAHKFNQVNGYAFSNTYENEIFTDLTAVVLGFGKYMLNGKKTTFNENNFERTISIGYLNSKQLSFIYLTVNCIKGVRVNSILSGLKKDVVDDIYDIYIHHLDYFFSIDWLSYTISKNDSYRLIVAQLCKSMRLVNTNWAYAKEEFSKLNDVENLIIANRPNLLCLSVLNDKSYRSIKSKIQQLLFDTKKVDLQNSQNLKNHKKENIDKSMLSEFSCPNCDAILKNSSNKKGILCCPSCSFKFAADTCISNDKIRIKKIHLKSLSFLITFIFRYLLSNIESKIKKVFIRSIKKLRDNKIEAIIIGFLVIFFLWLIVSII